MYVESYVCIWAMCLRVSLVVSSYFTYFCKCALYSLIYCLTCGFFTTSLHIKIGSHSIPQNSCALRKCKYTPSTPTPSKKPLDSIKASFGAFQTHQIKVLRLTLPFCPVLVRHCHISSSHQHGFAHHLQTKRPPHQDTPHQYIFSQSKAHPSTTQTFDK